MPCYAPLQLYKSSKGPHPITGKWPLTGLTGGNPSLPVTIPCGQCIGCRLEKSRQWAIRCLHESKLHNENSFLTLTYNDLNLVWGLNRPTLFPRHLQLFLKRLRKKYGEGIRFFACGEYGDLTSRPHYHACIFGHDFADKKIYTQREGINLYQSEDLNKLWGLGFCTIGEVNFDTAAYVARYCLKKRTGKDKNYYEDQSIIPEFTRMSRRRGIGYKFYEKFTSDLYNYDHCIVNGLKIKPPKYYNSLFEVDNPEKYAIIKTARKQALENVPDLYSKSRIAVKLEIKLSKTIQLKRGLS